MIGFKTGYAGVWSTVWLAAWPIWGLGLFSGMQWVTWLAFGMWTFCLGMTLGKILGR